MSLTDRISLVTPLKEGMIVSLYGGQDIAYSFKPTLAGVVLPYDDSDEWCIYYSNGTNLSGFSGMKKVLLSDQFREQCAKYLEAKYHNSPSPEVELYAALQSLVTDVVDLHKERDWKEVPVAAIGTALLPFTWPIGVHALLAHRQAIKKGLAIGSGDVFNIPVGLTIGAPILLVNALRAHYNGKMQLKPNLPEGDAEVALIKSDAGWDSSDRLYLKLPQSGELLTLMPWDRTIFKGSAWYEYRDVEQERFGRHLESIGGKTQRIAVDPLKDQKLAQAKNKFNNQVGGWLNLREYFDSYPEEFQAVLDKVRE